MLKPSIFQAEIQRKLKLLQELIQNIQMWILNIISDKPKNKQISIKSIVHLKDCLKLEFKLI
jgi:hypothetical protein